jgi:uncharacterized protein YndB with AHSA1/START domain
MKWILLAAIIALPFSVFAETLPEGKKKTGKQIHAEVVVKASPETIFELWTSNEGVKKFFGLDAEIENKSGGKYFVYFDPKDRRLSSEGARVLRYEPPNFLSFEWRGKPEMVDMNVQPFPTWVEVHFESADGKSTHVTLDHYGFGEGGTWDQSYQFFSAAWPEVLNRLQLFFEPRSH